jgi:UDP-glucuronate 4-epimerase
MKKILITGGAGFIGFHLVKKFLESDNQIVILDNLNDYYDISYKLNRLEILGLSISSCTNRQEQSIKYSNLVFYKSDICDKEFIDVIFESHCFDMVIHLAAQAGVRYSIENPHAYINSNIVGFHNILESSQKFGVKNFIYASSSSVYGDSSKVPFSENENVDKPTSLYAATKKSNELIAHSYSHLYGIRTIGLRFFTVYGPNGRPDMAYFAFTKSILNDEIIKVFNNGNLSRDFTYIDDIVLSIEHLVKLINFGRYEFSNYEVFNIGNSNPAKLFDFIGILESCIGKNAKIELTNMQKGDVHDTFSDSTKLYSAISLSPNFTLSEGLSIFVEWYIQFHNAQK